MRRLETKDIAFSYGAGAVLMPVVFLLNLFGGRRGESAGGAVRRILVVEFWHLGDLVMITAPLKGLKKKFPGARIDLVASKISAELLKHNPAIDRIIPFEAPWVKHKYNICTYDMRALFGIVRNLRHEGYDLGIAFRGDLRDNLFIYCAGARRRVGYGFAGGALFLTDTVGLNRAKPHQVDQMLELDRYLGIDTDALAPELYITEEESAGIERTLLEKGVSRGDYLVAINPGSRSPLRLWKSEGFAEVADHIIDKRNKKVVIVCGGDQGRIGEAVLGFMKHKDVPYFEGLSVRRLAALYRRCDLVVGLDTGPAHIAGGVGTPVVVLFGPQKPEWYGPYGVESIVVKAEVPCAPCRQKACYVRPTCMELISPRQVIEAVDTMLEKLERSTRRK